MLRYANIDGEIIARLQASTGPLAAIAVAVRNTLKWLVSPPK